MNSNRSKRDSRSDGLPRSPSRAKRQKTAAEDFLEKDDEAKEDVMASALPFRLTILSGYLPLEDSGRVLLRLSKGTAVSIFEDDAVSVVGAGDSRPFQVRIHEKVWEYLCRRKWTNPTTISNLLVLLGNDVNRVDLIAPRWEKMFRKFTPRASVPRLHRASIEDYSFMFSLFESTEGGGPVSNSPVSSCLLTGQQASDFLRTGNTDWIALDQPVKIGHFPSEDEAFIQGQDPVGTISSRMHAMRKSDGRSCELNTHEYLLIEDYIDREGMYSGERVTSQPRSVAFFDGNGSIVDIGKIEDIVMNPLARTSFGFTIDAEVHATFSDDTENGGVDCHITHASFRARLWLPGEDSANFDEYDALVPGTTVADILEQLNVEWV